jgi:hypothetical protein
MGWRFRSDNSAPQADGFAAWTGAPVNTCHPGCCAVRAGTFSGKSPPISSDFARIQELVGKPPVNSPKNAGYAA